MMEYVRRYVYGWYMYGRAFWKTQTKKHGAGRTSLVISHRMGMASRWLVDGQMRHGKPPGYLRKWKPREWDSTALALRKFLEPQRDAEIARLHMLIARMEMALEPFARSAASIKQTEYFKNNDPRAPSLDTPVSYLVQKLNEPITIAAVFEAHSVLEWAQKQSEKR